MMSDRLTPRHERFVQEYLLDLNATQAAIRAGYSAKTARQARAENLSKPVISARVRAGQAELVRRLADANGRPLRSASVVVYLPDNQRDGCGEGDADP